MNSNISLLIIWLIEGVKKRNNCLKWLLNILRKIEVMMVGILEIKDMYMLNLVVFFWMVLVLGDVIDLFIIYIDFVDMGIFLWGNRVVEI